MRNEVPRGLVTGTLPKIVLGADEASGKVPAFSESLGPYALGRIGDKIRGIYTTYICRAVGDHPTCGDIDQILSFMRDYVDKLDRWDVRKKIDQACAYMTYRP